MKEKRKVELVVLSDVHLGTFGCHAKELLHYLKSIDPQHLVLNGDIIDVWQFSKKYFPTSHLKVIRYLMKLIQKGTRVTYITGNHDEAFRRFVGFEMGGFELKNKLLLDIHGNEVWIFHGDVFDVSMQFSKPLAKLGGMGYDLLILLNRFINWVLKIFGKKPFSMSKKIKDSVKSAIKFINNFEKTACEIAIEKGYEVVICGHIHQPQMKEYSNSNGKVMYLNSGDWIENLTALEFNLGAWKLIRYEDLDFFDLEMEDVEEEISRKAPKVSEIADFIELIK